MRSSLLCMLSSMLLFSASSLHAQDMSAMHGSHDMSHHTASPAQTQVYQSQGVIKQITDDAITIAHKAIPALRWPPMTMQFVLAQGSAMPQVNVGENVDFTFTQSEDGYQLVSVTPQR